MNLVRRAVPSARVYVVLAACAIGNLLSGTGAAADPGRNQYQFPHTFERPVCYWVAQQVGRTIAWARWEQRYPEHKTRNAGLGQGTPQWVIEVVNDWIADAYAWQATDEQVRAWAEELGDVSDVPRADQLSVYQTIAIWMRRIGRDCNARAGRTSQE